ncbi:hypothetical protein CHRYSEO8AT_10188 [Chryseobacterium sp. 8AT]|nr:hypothetical protein CHRYSEO8AT_10188 [Chryseobacterium sp. 8AT]
MLSEIEDYLLSVDECYFDEVKRLCERKIFSNIKKNSCALCVQKKLLLKT